jgi:CDP-glucose 4,6-dehydratase
MSGHWDKVKWEDVSAQYGGPYESNLLKLNCDKALHHLRWNSVWAFEETVRETALWYRKYYESPNNSMAEFSLRQIAAYVSKAQQSGLPWAK